MPESIFQSWLDRVGQSFFDKDFDVFAGAVHVPMVLRTRSADMEILTREQLRGGFDAWCNMLGAQHATHLVRRTLSVMQPESDQIDGTYSTHILRDAVMVVPPFKSYMTLRRVDGQWLCTALSSGVDNQRWPIDLPRVRD